MFVRGGGPAGKLSLYNLLFVYNDNDETIQAGAGKFSLGNSAKGRKCRYFDGVINDTENSDPQQLGPFSSPTRVGEITTLHDQTEVKLKRTKQAIHIMPSDIMTDDIDIGLLREALAAKSAQTASLKTKLEEAERQVQSAMKKLQCEQGEKEILQTLNERVTALEGDLAVQRLAATEKDQLLEIANNDITQLSTRIASLDTKRTELKSISQELALIKEEASNSSADISKLEGSIEALTKERDSAIKKMNEVRTCNGVAEEVLSTLKNEKYELTSSLEQTKADQSPPLSTQKTYSEVQRSIADDTAACDKRSENSAVAGTKTKLTKSQPWLSTQKTYSEVQRSIADDTAARDKRSENSAVAGTKTKLTKTKTEYVSFSIYPRQHDQQLIDYFPPLRSSFLFSIFHFLC